MHEIAILMQLSEVFYRDEKSIFIPHEKKFIKFKTFILRYKIIRLKCILNHKISEPLLLNKLQYTKSTKLTRRLLYELTHGFYTQNTQSFVVLGSFNYSLHDSL